MNITTRPLAIGEKVIDTDWKIGPGTARGLWLAGVRTLIRYVGYGPPGPGDIDAVELELELGIGFTVVLVQHPRKPANNVLSSDTGASDAAWAIRNAIAAGYDPAKVPVSVHAPSLIADLEGVRNPGAGVVGFATRWAIDTSAARFRPVKYLGYDCGLTSADCDALPGDPEFFCDAGPYSERPRPAKGYALKQHPQTTIAGVGVDEDDVLRANAIYGVRAA